MFINKFIVLPSQALIPILLQSPLNSHFRENEIKLFSKTITKYDFSFNFLFNHILISGKKVDSE